MCRVLCPTHGLPPPAHGVICSTTVSLARHATQGPLNACFARQESLALLAQPPSPTVLTVTVAATQWKAGSVSHAPVAHIQTKPERRTVSAARRVSPVRRAARLASTAQEHPMARKESTHATFVVEETRQRMHATSVGATGLHVRAAMAWLTAAKSLINAVCVEATGRPVWGVTACLTAARN